MSDKSDRKQEIEIYPGVFYGGTEKFEREKIEARMRLLEMLPEKAQEISNKTLSPQNWKLDESNLDWEESIETDGNE